MTKSAELLLLTLQKQQADHDERAHRDILSLDTQTRIKHMVLHFLKYIGKIADARTSQNQSALEQILVDALIICLATANSLNVSLGEKLGQSDDINSLARDLSKKMEATDVFLIAILRLSAISGRMAKAVESS